MIRVEGLDLFVDGMRRSTTIWFVSVEFELGKSEFERMPAHSLWGRGAQRGRVRFYENSVVGNWIDGLPCSEYFLPVPDVLLLCSRQFGSLGMARMGCVCILSSLTLYGPGTSGNSFSDCW